jgi:RND family efflux transporter MFP subunit
MMDGRGPSDAQPEAGAADEARKTPARRRIAWILSGCVVASVALLVALGAWGQAQRRAATLDVLAQQRDFVPSVRTVSVEPVTTPRVIELPASLQPFNTATIYARATGYIDKRFVDIGSRLHAGDLLAMIAAPDLDQQLAQARATLVQTQAALTQSRAALEQAHANNNLANITNDRYAKLAARGFAAQQDADNARLSFAARQADVRNAEAAVAVADANVKSQSANVSRLEQLTGFERVVAPFDGVVTARQVEVGDLVTADASTGTSMFAMARTDVLRVQVYVPQDAVFGLKDGDAAEVIVPEMPGQRFHGVVARHAGALQPGTRTLLTEVDIDNADGVLAAGIYGVVRLSVPRPHPVVIVPSNAVIFDRNGLRVALFDNGVVRLRQLDIAEDDGAQVVVRAGVNPGDRVILNPPADLTDGMRVAIAQTDEKVAAAGPEPAPAAAAAAGK